MVDTNNPPAGGTGEEPSVADVADALGDILDDPATDTVYDDEEHAEEATGANADGSDNSEPNDAEDEEADSEDSDDILDDEESEGSERARDELGRFVSDDSRVKLSDGTTTTIAELKSGALRQSDYTRKTQELADSRKTFEADQQRVSQLTQQLDEQFARVSQALEQTRPQRPMVPFEEDPMAHNAYTHALQEWNEADQYWGQQYQATMQNLQAEQMKQLEAVRTRETEALYGAIPQLRDTSRRQAFTAEAVRIGADYGFTEQEIRTVVEMPEGTRPDHRFIAVLRDAMRYRRSQAKAPRVKAEVEAKPRMLKGRRRSNPKQTQRRATQARTERLRNEGSREAGIAALMDMDL